MEERRYLISDAAKLTAVEPHVLRYWEEELELSIERTELGHRYYTRENIETFQTIKRLKEEGLSLKAIRLVLQRMGQSGRGAETKRAAKQTAPQEMEEQGGFRDILRENQKEAAAQKQKKTSETEDTQETSLAIMENNARRLQQFQKLMEEILERVVRSNNEELQRRIEEAVSRETDYLLRMQEQREEARFRKLDQAIREHQQNSRYVAAAKEKGSFLRWFRR